MNILVTGASGFLGTALCPYLRQSGHTVVAPSSQECDLTQSGALNALPKQSFDQIYHLAAWYQAGDFCLRHAGEQWIRNQQINTNVLAWWQQCQPSAKLIAMGSSCAYPPDRALTEDNFLAGQPIESLFTYGHTKRMLYIGLRALHQQFGSNYLCLVPSTLYGANFHTDGRQLHFIFDLIRKIVRSQRSGDPVVLWGDGHQKRELIFVEDAVRIMVQLAGTVHNELINIGGGREHSIREFARIICEIVGHDFESIQFDTSRYVGAKSKCLEVGKLADLLPQVQFTPLRQGLEKTVEWFVGNGQKLLAST